MRSAKFRTDKFILSFRNKHFVSNFNYTLSTIYILPKRQIHLQSNNNIKYSHKNAYFQYKHHNVLFCTQIKEQKDEEDEDELKTKYDEQIETNEDDEQYDSEDNEYEEDEEEEEEEEEEEIEDDEEYENESESEDDAITDDDEEEQEDAEEEDDDAADGEELEISENFDFETYSENVMNELFENLPQNNRIEGKSIEHFISPLILKPLEVLPDDIHNKFSLMHNDMDNLLKESYKIPIENESELREMINLAFDKLNIYTTYIENNWPENVLRHSPRHYLMRQLRVDHGKIVYLCIRKIMYYKYPKWVQSDNWASADMAQEKEREFIVSEELGIRNTSIDENIDNNDLTDDASSIDDNTEITQEQ